MGGSFGPESVAGLGRNTQILDKLG